MGDKASAKIKLGGSVGGGGGDNPTADYINFGSNLDGGNSGNGSNSGEQLGFGGIPLFNQNYMGIPGATYTTIYNRGDNDSPAVGTISSALAAIYNYTGISVGNFTTISNSRGTYYQYQTAGSGIAAANGIGAGSGVVLHFGLLPDDDEANQGGDTWEKMYVVTYLSGQESAAEDGQGV